MPRTAALAASLAAFAIAAPPLVEPTVAQTTDTQRTTTLTVYQNEIAAVRQRQSVNLKAGTARLAIDNLSPGIVAGSLDLAAPEVTVQQQRLRPWPVSRQRLLQEAVGQRVTLIRTPETAEAQVTREGRLIAAKPDIVVEVDGRIEINPPGHIALPKLPQDVPESPTAVFDIASDTDGTRPLDLRYLSRGLSWSATYVARWDRESQTLDLTGRAQIQSQLSRPMTADKVKLVAGTVSLSNADRRPAPQQMRAMTAEADAATSKARPTAQQQADLRVYALGSPVTLRPNATLSRRLMAADDIAAETQYRITGLATGYPNNGRDPDRQAASLRVEIPNTAEAGLTKPLPAGAVRVYDGDIFRGAHSIPDTPPGTRLTLDLGTSFDVTANAEQTGFDKLSRDSYELARRITLNNAKAEAVAVRIVGQFPGDWDMLSESTAHTMNENGQPIWTVNVPAGDEADMNYELRVRR